ncbi:MAG: Ig-like domain-containing protein, partial [Campylobacterota bacterium]|nr:Ig-like domain-containing protein [Campylobacterota bacterium]
MSSAIGKIVSLHGKFYAKSEDGSLRVISKGDEIYEGETIIGDSGNKSIDSVIVSMEDGTDIVVLGNESQLFDASLSQVEFSEEETVTHSESIETMLADSGDLDDVEDIETAAGEASGVESSEGGEAEFSVHNEQLVDVNATLRDVEFKNNPESKGSDQEENIYADLVVDSLSADILSSSDSGRSDIDNITNDNTTTIAGSTEANSTIVITDALGNEVGRATADAQGNFTITTTELDDGTQNLNITATDLAGNTKSITQEITVDTTTSNSVKLSEDSGDDVVNASEVSTSDISGNVEAGSSIDSLTVTDGTNILIIDV